MGNTVDLIRNHSRRHYIETGSSAGDGLQKALDAGCEIVCGIECDMERRARAEKRFKDDKRVILFAGQSERFLGKVLQNMYELQDGKRNGIIVFLDAHRVSANAMETYPLLFELNEIKKSGIKDCVIMVDDVRLFDSELKAPRERVVNAIVEINSKYKITYENSDTNEKDILVADL